MIQTRAGWMRSANATTVLCRLLHTHTNTTYLGPEFLEPAGLHQVVQVLDVLDGRVVQHLLAQQTLADDEVRVGQIRQSLET